LRAFLDEGAKIKLSNNQMRLAFAYFDENGDNKVSEDEFIYCILPDSKKKSKKHSFLSSFITKSH
jgi:hypothetical protein